MGQKNNEYNNVKWLSRLENILAAENNKKMG